MGGVINEPMCSAPMPMPMPMPIPMPMPMPMPTQYGPRRAPSRARDDAGGLPVQDGGCQSPVGFTLAAAAVAVAAGGLSWTQPALLGAPSSSRRKSM